MAVPVIVVKALATAATDKRFWKLLTVLIAAVLMPLIIAVLLILALFVGTEDANTRLLDCSFRNAPIPSEFTEEQRGEIENMRTHFAELDKAIFEWNTESEEEKIDGDMVKSVFYSLQFGAPIPTDEDGNEIEIDYKSFCYCFYELDIEQLDTALANISTEFSYYTATNEQRLMAEKIYEYLCRDS